MKRGFWRVALASVLAPILSPLIISVQLRSSLDGFVVLMVLTYAYINILIALPLFFLWYRLGWRRWWQFLGALVLADILFALLLLVPPGGWISRDMLEITTLYATHAIPASLIFWLIARPRPSARPEPRHDEGALRPRRPT